MWYSKKGRNCVGVFAHFRKRKNRKDKPEISQNGGLAKVGAKGEQGQRGECFLRGTETKD